MAALPFRRQERVNLSTAEVLIAGADPDGVEVLAEMFAGFGVHTPRRCASGAEAMTIVGEKELNLLVVDSALADSEGDVFISWLRRCGSRSCVHTGDRHHGALHPQQSHQCD